MNGMTEVRTGVWVANESTSVFEQKVSAAIVLSDGEAEELYRFTRYEYLSPNTYPALVRLIARLTTRYAPRA